MEYTIPESYNLNVDDIDLFYINYEHYIIIGNFKLYCNENGVIYKIVSDIELKYLLNFLYFYKNIVITKIYNYLTIKYLLSLSQEIKNIKRSKISCFCYKSALNTTKTINKIVYLREYLITTNNNTNIGTCEINSNYCLIVNNKTLNKSLIAIIDNNCIIDCLYKLLENVFTPENISFEDIKIFIIGGSYDNINVLYNIYEILKIMKLSKYVFKTHILSETPLKSIQYNTNTDEIYNLDINHPEEDKSFHRYFTVLHKNSESI